MVLRAKSGLTVSGTIVIDNTSTSPVPFALSEIRLIACTTTEGSTGQAYGYSSPSGDGSFTINGLTAGRLHLAMSERKGHLSAECRPGGVPQPGVIQSNDENPTPGAGMLIGRDNPANNLTLHVESGNCRLRGTVLLADGTSPNGASIMIVARPVDGGGTSYQSADLRGRFLLEGLVPGQYEITARIQAGGDLPALAATKTVTISNGADNNVTLTAGLPAGQEK